MRRSELVWQRATVVTDSAGVRWLRFSPGECERCARGEGCGASLFARMFTRGASRVALPADAAALPGETVAVGVPGRWLLRAAAAAYLAPLGAFIIAALGAELFWPGRDALALIAGVAGASAALGAAGIASRAFAPRFRIEPYAPASLEYGSRCKQFQE